MRFHPPLRPLLLALLLGVSAPALAQDLTVSFNPRTGDVWVDTWLNDVNRYGRAYPEPFIDEVVRYHRAPRDLVVELLGRPGWTPGDVYYACGLASVLGRPCRYVVDEYERDRGAGWGVLAQRLGIKPGSAEFHRLKRGFVPTYDRWSRPIRLDADLERAFPGRARAGDRGKANAHGAGASKAPGPKPSGSKAAAGKSADKGPARANGGDAGKGGKSSAGKGRGNGSDAGKGGSGGKGPKRGKGGGKG